MDIYMLRNLQFSLVYTVYTRLLAALFLPRIGLYFACGLYAQHTQRDKVFA